MRKMPVGAAGLMARRAALCAFQILPAQGRVRYQAIVIW